MKVTLTKSKETKGTVVYVAPDTITPSIYFRKAELRKEFGEFPATLTVTIEK